MSFNKKNFCTCPYGLFLVTKEKIFHSNQMEVFSHATYVSDSKMMLLCMVEDGRGGPHVSPIDESSIDIFLLALSDLVLHVEIRRLYFMAEGLNLVMTSQ